MQHSIRIMFLLPFCLLAINTFGALSAKADLSSEKEDLINLCFEEGNAPSCTKLLDLTSSQSSASDKATFLNTKCQIAFIAYEKKRDRGAIDVIKGILEASSSNTVKANAAGVLGSIYFVEGDYENAARMADEMHKVDEQELSIYRASDILLKYYATAKTGDDDIMPLLDMENILKGPKSAELDLSDNYIWAIHNAITGQDQLDYKGTEKEVREQDVVRGFYFGEKAVIAGNKPKARWYLGRAVDSSMKGWPEYLMAQSELEKLGGPLSREEALKLQLHTQ